MSKLLTVIGFCSDDAAKAEKLCDWIYELEDRHQSGHCLLVASADVHQEMQIKVKIAAEVAFESVDLYLANASTLETHGGKTEHVNNLFGQAALKVSQTYTWPWLWMEPDCLPLVPYWQEQLWAGYSSQPKQYMGPILKFMQEKEERFLVSRVAVYPFFAYADLGKHTANVVPFEQLSSVTSVPKCSKTKLIQYLPIAAKEDCAKIRQDAVLLHSDKLGHAMKFIRERRESQNRTVIPVVPNPVPSNGSDMTEVEPVLRKRRGRPPKVKPVEKVSA